MSAKEYSEVQAKRADAEKQKEIIAVEEQKLEVLKKKAKQKEKILRIEISSYAEKEYGDMKPKKRINFQQIYTEHKDYFKNLQSNTHTMEGMKNNI